MKRMLPALAVMIVMLLPDTASACPVCYGDPNSNMTRGAANAVMFLLGIVGFVQIGFVALFVTFWLRAKRRREKFHLLQGGLH